MIHYDLLGFQVTLGIRNKQFFICFSNKHSLCCYHKFYSTSELTTIFGRKFKLPDVVKIFSNCFKEKKTIRKNDCGFVDFHFVYKEITELQLHFLIFSHHITLSLPKDMLKEELTNYFSSIIFGPFKIFYTCFKTNESAVVAIETNNLSRRYIISKQGVPSPDLPDLQSKLSNKFSLHLCKSFVA